MVGDIEKQGIPREQTPGGCLEPAPDAFSRRRLEGGAADLRVFEPDPVTQGLFQASPGQSPEITLPLGVADGQVSARVGPVRAQDGDVAVLNTPLEQEFA